jgi:squalene-associated FAD-dependent desaturase
MSVTETSSKRSYPPTVSIVGGGLAGLAAAVGLSAHGVRVRLFEARRRLGGRAGSFRDPDTDEWVDHCQHVSLGCCTNYADFCRRAGIGHLFRRERTLHFFAPDGRRFDVRGSRWLPAPFHLAPSLLRLSYLSRKDRIEVVRALAKLPRAATQDGGTTSMGDWLRKQRQSAAAIDGFWSVVLVSALSESVERASLAAAGKVFADGFMASRGGYVVELPDAPLNELYESVAAWLRQHSAEVRLSAAVRQVGYDGRRATGAIPDSGEPVASDAVIVAVPWRQLPRLLPVELRERVISHETLNALEPSPITSLHLWLDRRISPLAHAVFVGRLSQWVFQRQLSAPNGGESSEHYYQVVISASRELAGRDRSEILDEVLGDLRAVWPAASSARLMRWRLVTQSEAVFSPLPGIERLRPAQRTGVPNFFLAGDWTRTGWPATMESAVRSGYLAAEATLAHLGIDAQLLVPEPRAWLPRRLGLVPIGNTYLSRTLPLGSPQRGDNWLATDA